MDYLDLMLIRKFLIDLRFHFWVSQNCKFQFGDRRQKKKGGQGRVDHSDSILQQPLFWGVLRRADIFWNHDKHLEV